MKRKLVVFADGVFGLFEICLATGACLIGEPTAYVKRRGQLVWVIPNNGRFEEAP